MQDKHNFLAGHLTFILNITKSSTVWNVFSFKSKLPKLVCLTLNVFLTTVMQGSKSCVHVAKLLTVQSSKQRKKQAID